MSEKRDEAEHVFDQTNGVLGDEPEAERKRPEATTPPRSFGVPPVTSL